MIQRQSTGFEVEGSLTGEKIELAVDMAAMPHIMRVLTDLYSDPEYAVIREYTTNALDAHVAAGNTDPIRVYTPTHLSPFFRVRDLGLGLNKDDIRTIYSKYGASTKRDTNDQVGMLGLGCKSALTYASQFTLTGVKDGVRCQVAISRDASGAGSMTVVDESPTDAPNSVEVSVPVRDANTFEQKAKQFFRFWEDGTVLLNDEAPPTLDALKLSDNILIRKIDRYAGDAFDYVVMGNVPYPVKNCLAGDGLAYTHGLVAFVDIGDVDFTPSREELHYTDVTNDTLRRVREEFATAAQGAIQRKVDDCQTRPDALAALHEWREILPSAARQQTYTFKGEVIPTVWTPPQGRAIEVPARSHVESRHVYLHHGVQAEAWHKIVWVGGFPSDSKWTAPRARKLRKYAEENGIETPKYVLCETLPDSPWIDKSTFIQWEKVNEIKLDRAVSLRTGRIPGSYPVIEDGRSISSKIAADIDQSKLVLYAEGGRWAGDYYKDLLNEKVKGGYTLVRLSSNRVAKFKRDFPQAQHVEAYVKGLFEKWQKSLTQKQRAALALFDAGRSRYNYHHERNGGELWRQLRALDARKIEDPAIVRACQLTKVDLTSVNQSRSLFTDAGFYAEIKEQAENPLSKYPLFNSSELDHSYIYINAVYAANQKGV